MPTARTTKYCEELPFRTLPWSCRLHRYASRLRLRNGTYVSRVAAAPKSVCVGGGGGLHDPQCQFRYISAWG